MTTKIDSRLVKFNYSVVDADSMTIEDRWGKQWRIVAVTDDGICTMELVAHREIGYTLPTIEMTAFAFRQILGIEKEVATDDSKTFNVGQTYEAPSGLKVVATNRISDTVQLSTAFTTVTRDVLVDDGGEFVMWAEGVKLYALDTPKWFYGGDDLDFSCEQLQRSLDRDCDRAANFDLSAMYGCGALI